MNIQAESFDTANTLAWLVAAGVDVIVDEAPRNWLSAPAPPLAPVVTPVARGAARPPPGPGQSAASSLAAAAIDLAGLDAALRSFAHPLRRNTPPELMTGNIASGIVFISDQPEAEGSPAAVLVARMLGAIGLDEASCAKTHLLPWPTLAGVAPRDEQIAAFAPFVARAIALSAPRLVLAFGDKAAGLAGREAGAPVVGISKLRGKWLETGGVPMIATFHPRQLLAQPDLKKLAWADLQAFQHRMTQ